MIVITLLLLKILEINSIPKRFRLHSELPTNLEGKDFFIKLSNNNLNLDLYIGEPHQKIPFTLKMGTYPTSVIDSNEPSLKNIIKYNKENSNTHFFYVKQPSKRFTNIDFYDASKLNDFFYYKDEKGALQNLGRLNFYSMTRITNSFQLNPTPGIIGLKLYDNDMIIKKNEEGEGPIMDIESNFFKQLKKNNYTNGYCVTINYTSFNEAEVIVGEYPHIYSENDNRYTKNNFCFVKCTPNKNYNFDFYIDSVEYNGKKIINEKSNDYITVALRIENGLIKPSSYFVYEVEHFFFNPYISKKKCEKIIINDENETYSFICDKDIDFSLFKNLSFHFYGYNVKLNLTHNDLFYFNQKDQKYYFLAEIQQGQRDNWELGAPFFRKHLLAFEQDKKIISFYSNNFNANSPDSNNKYFVNNNYILPWILLGLTIVALVIISLVLIKFIKNKRKKKANELVDEFEYSTSNDSIVNENTQPYIIKG